MKPTRTRIKMYQVGFGDCFVVTFEYAKRLPDGRNHRHMLIDFGSTRLPKRGPKLADTAQLILEHTDGHLDALVVSHRHKDHLDGFGDADAGPLTEQLRPRMVLRPWTDDPNLKDNATSPAGEVRDAKRRRLLQGLRTGQDVAAGIAAAVRQQDPDVDRRSLAGRLAAEADTQIPNQEALDGLDGFAKAAGRRGIYAHYGTEIPFEEIIPGVTCEVLGPPTIEMSRGIVKQRATDPDEFWLAPIESIESAAAIQASVNGDERHEWDKLSEPGGIGPARWLLENLKSQQQNAQLRLVRMVDDALNNTSLILLLTVGASRRLLFAGDAQIENWSYVLGKANQDTALRRKLEKVDLYKVGHHGSRNATPKSLFELWNRPQTASRPMTALMSTLPGVHGKSTETAVPRQTLINALNKRMTLHRTDQMGAAPFLEVVAPTTGSGTFELAER